MQWNSQKIQITALNGVFQYSYFKLEPTSCLYCSFTSASHFISNLFLLCDFCFTCCSCIPSGTFSFVQCQILVVFLLWFRFASSFGSNVLELLFWISSLTAASISKIFRFIQFFIRLPSMRACWYLLNTSPPSTHLYSMTRKKSLLFVVTDLWAITQFSPFRGTNITSDMWPSSRWDYAEFFKDLFNYSWNLALKHFLHHTFFLFFSAR